MSMKIREESKIQVRERFYGVGAVGLLRLLGCGRRIAMSAMVDAREELSADDIFAIYYKKSGLEIVLVIELLEHAAQELGLPVRKLRPQDRFSVELAPRRGNELDSGCGILLCELGRLAKKRGRTIQGEIESIDDYLRAMAPVYYADRSA
ncbi:hypothetical protein [Luteimonas sp. RC10]|uniref:hypothetical protein n=1 Tax=Luteimonas sp. RC10 TaxID=2587035 RepID=UPI0016215F21|nr:hypothetical protein [Luteimonas sp. RC10]MBB3344730.1 ABC-type transporter Mla MlaB component [Luteimonas sp. RC10]